jgi:type IV pilus assembly protein PilB
MTSRFLQAVLDAKLIAEDLVRAKADEAKNDSDLLESLINLDSTQASALLDIRADQLGMSAIEINPYSIDQAVVSTISEDHARRFLAIPLFRIGNDLTLAMADPTDLVAIDQIAEGSGCDILPVLASRTNVEEAINRFYGIDPILKSLITEAQRTEAQVETIETSDEINLDDLAKDESPIIRMVNVIILKAVRQGASDVHIEPDHKILRVRYRIDGRLGEEQHIPLSLHAGMTSRVKILADLDLAQKRLPQDGRISLQAEGRRIDLRVSTLPTVSGEKIVLRLLDTQQSMTSLRDLGLRDELRRNWEEMIRLPHGILLVTGPTGSGKTTTLYASLSAINEPDTNIVTVEDPVEFDFPIINQVQVHPKAGLEFSSALRSILRQDPDVIMVGEIRDRETAQIAVRAALTGHLVFSTLHTNDASSAATRLIDMGVEPYLVASALKGVLAQRLVRRVCPNCVRKVPVDPQHLPPEVFERITRGGIEACQGEGCRHCNGTGYRGRVALHELLPVNDEIEREIVRQLPSSEIDATARRLGMESLFDDGLAKVQAGETTLEQVLLATRLSEESDSGDSTEPVVDTTEIEDDIVDAIVTTETP